MDTSLAKVLGQGYQLVRSHLTWIPAWLKSSDMDTSLAGVLGQGYQLAKGLGQGYQLGLTVNHQEGWPYGRSPPRASLAGLGGPQLGQGEGERGPVGGQGGALPQQHPALPAHGGEELGGGHSLEGLRRGLVVVEEVLQGPGHGLGSGRSWFESKKDQGGDLS